MSSDSAAAKPAVFLPGDALPESRPSSSATAYGTHLVASHRHASLAGTTPSTQPPLSIQRPASALTRRPLLPAVSSTVLARVLRCTPRQAIVAILTVDDVPLAHTGTGAGTGEHWQGLIRQQDVRATEKDKVKVADSFRPGDVVRAEVISLGDQSNYYLSTARNELGVVLARSERGNVMAPVDWRRMRDTVTGEEEGRKVAKPG